jgi:protoheme IX farnesyltransferase
MNTTPTGKAQCPPCVQAPAKNAANPAEQQTGLISDLLNLSKIRITAAVAFTTIVGFVLAHGRFSFSLLLPLFGIFLQASGSAAMNQLQEWKMDARVARTSNRPIASGRVSPKMALFVSLGLLTAGSILLLPGTGITGALLGLAAAFIYNGVYTPLKKRTPFAVLPGSFIGAIPPMVGWLAGGGYLHDHTIHQVAFFFFIWQVPHFWLLLLAHEQSYRDAGLPSLFDSFDHKQIIRLTWLWTAATALSGMAAPLFKALRHGPSGWLIALSAIGLVVMTARWLKLPASLKIEGEQWENHPRKIYMRCFMLINTYALLVMITLVVDRLV